MKPSQANLPPVAPSTLGVGGCLPKGPCTLTLVRSEVQIWVPCSIFSFGLALSLALGHW